MKGSAIPDLMKAMQVFWRYYPVHLNEQQLDRVPGVTHEILCPIGRSAGGGSQQSRSYFSGDGLSRTPG